MQTGAKTLIALANHVLVYLTVKLARTHRALMIHAWQGLVALHLLSVPFGKETHVTFDAALRLRYTSLISLVLILDHL